MFFLLSRTNSSTSSEALGFLNWDRAMSDVTKTRKLSRRKKKTLRRADKVKAKTKGQLPPNENLQKFPDETYGDMQLPFSRR